jgi:hypothetical protein
MATHTGTDGGTVNVVHDEDGVYLRARYSAAHLDPDTARRLAADLLALADEADEWRNAAAEPYRP